MVGLGAPWMNDDIQRALGRIEAQNVLILEQLKEHKEERKALSEKVEKIEKKINYAAGAIAVFSFIFSFLLTPLLGWHK